MSDTSACDREQRFNDIVAAHLEAVEAGQPQDWRRLQQQYPDLATELAEFFGEQEDVAKLAAGLRSLAAELTPEPTPQTPEGVPPNVELGDYRVVREIGRGGMGIVYEAEQKSLGRRVALKVLPWAATLDRQQLQRFRNEAQAAAHLHHTNIVPVFEAGCAAQVHYYAMQLIEGQSLAVLLQHRRRLSGSGSTSGAGLAAGASTTTLDHQPLAADTSTTSAVKVSPPTGAEAAPQAAAPSAQASFATLPWAAFFAEVVRLGIQAAEALAYAHQRGVVHRDIKPANLLLDVRGQLWITDFGLAKAPRSGEITRTGDVVGTLRYLAPERFRGESTASSDIYSLGLTLYEMLTLVPAFPESQQEALVRQVLSSEPPRLRELEPRIPRDLETIVLKAIAKEAARRYPSATDLAADLRRWLNGEPVQARPVGPVERLWRWCRRRPTLASLTAALIAVFLVGFAGVLWQWLRAEGNYQDALHAAAAEKTAKDDALVAAAAEKKAKDDALARQMEIEAVLDFVQSRIFAAARPEGIDGGLGRDVELRKALEAALVHVDQSFAKQPLIEARLRLTLGTSFWYLGDPKIAAQQYERSRTLYLKHRGAVHPDTIRATHNLALSYNDLNRRPEAAKLYDETLEASKAILGPDDHRTLLTANNLADAYYGLQRYDEALKLNEDTLSRMKATLGLSHPDTFMSMNNLGNSYWKLKRLQEALKLHQATLPLMKGHRGLDHTDTLSSMTSLANVYGDLERHHEALELRQEVVARRTAKLSRNHPETLKAINNLAHSYAALGRHQDALDLREETLARRRVKHGDDHPLTLQSMHSVASSLVKLERGAEAIPIIDECVQRAPGKGVHPSLIPWAMDLRLRHFQKSKDAAGCRSTADMWDKLNRSDADSLYTAACMRAVTAAVGKEDPKTPATDAARLASEQADAAIALLQKAAAAGYRDVDRMKKDRDLDPLRGRQEFKKLIADVEEKTQAAPK